MHTFLKLISVLVFGAAGLTTAFAWVACDHVLRIVATPLAIGALAGFFVLHFRRDKAPNFLRRQYKRYLERSGFCFGILVDSREGVAFLDIPFQSRYAKPSIAQIGLRQSIDPLSAAGREPFLTVEIECGRGAFGVGHFPVAIPAKFQGETLRLQATASVRYPEGKGEMLRFRNGVPVPHNERLPSLSVLGSLVWFVLLPWFVLFRRAGAGPTLNLVLPSGVAETLPEGVVPHTDTRWTLGDGDSLASDGPVN